jgi:hypothetical protein
MARRTCPAQELQLYASALRQFGVAPYLHAANPVVLSAKPGSVALEVPHPTFDWEFAPRVGPLAARMYRLAQVSVVAGGDTNWGAYLRGLADYAEIKTTQKFYLSVQDDDLEAARAGRSFDGGEHAWPDCPARATPVEEKNAGMDRLTRSHAPSSSTRARGIWFVLGPADAGR